MGSAKKNHTIGHIFYQDPSITLCTILKWNKLGPIAFVRYAPALHDSQCNVWGEVVVHGKGGVALALYHEGAPIGRADVGFHLFVFKNLNIVLRTSLGHQWFTIDSRGVLGLNNSSYGGMRTSDGKRNLHRHGWSEQRSEQLPPHFPWVVSVCRSVRKVD